MTDKEYLKKTGQIVDPASGEVLAEVVNDKVRLSPGWDLKGIVDCMNYVRERDGIDLLPDYN